VKQPLGFRAPAEAGETAAVFVRVPVAEARKLDRAALESGRPKREIVAGLLASLETGEATLGLAAPGASSPDVLTLDEAANLLRVDTPALRRLASRGDVPARRIGRDWRFSRAALLAWLAG
jgi:excisionase family DNA binding protein